MRLARWTVRRAYYLRLNAERAAAEDLRSKLIGGVAAFLLVWLLFGGGGR